MPTQGECARKDGQRVRAECERRDVFCARYTSFFAQRAGLPRKFRAGCDLRSFSPGAESRRFRCRFAADSLPIRPAQVPNHWFGGGPHPNSAWGPPRGLHDLCQAQGAVGQRGLRGAELIHPLIATARAMHHEVFQLDQTHKIPPQRAVLPAYRGSQFPLREAELLCRDLLGRCTLGPIRIQLFP